MSNGSNSSFRGSIKEIENGKKLQKNIKIDENIKKELDKIKSEKFTTINGVLRILLDIYYDVNFLEKNKKISENIEK